MGDVEEEESMLKVTGNRILDEHDRCKVPNGMEDCFETREEELEAALKRSVTALDDWINSYAPELCDDAFVREAMVRIMGEGGTLAYIADVQRQNREALGIKLPTNGERMSRKE